MKISFATTCMGRLHQLRNTYRINIDRAASYPGVEFVLVDYHSPDGLAEWVAENFAAELASGLLVFHRAPPTSSSSSSSPSEFPRSHAKNIAHRLCRSDLLVNLDADNFIQHGYCRYLAALFAGSRHAVARFREEQTGSGGRIAILRDDFTALGGYDEAMSGWGYEDIDLIARAVASGCEDIPQAGQWAGNLIHLDRTRQPGGLRRTWQRNKELSDRNLAAGLLIANGEGAAIPIPRPPTLDSRPAPRPCCL